MMTAGASSEEKGVESIRALSFRWRSDYFGRPQAEPALTASLIAIMAALFQLGSDVSSVNRDVRPLSVCQ